MKRLVVPALLLLAFTSGYALSLVRDARAQATPPRTATCFVNGAMGKRFAEDTETWMNTQLAAGKTDFFIDNAFFCAW